MEFQGDQMKISDFNPMISIIVLNYNGKQYLKDCFESLEQIEYDNYEIILVDNASTDRSIEFTKDIFPKIKLISLDRNYGFAEGNNKGAEKANGKYIVFLNNDTRVDKNWLSELINAIKIYGEDCIYSSKILFYDRPQILNTIGGVITPIGGGFDIGFSEMDTKEFNKVRYIGSPSGCSMLLKKSLFQQMGGFDKDYFAYFEDIDFGWRCWLFGYKTYYVPTSVVYHKFGGTAGPRNSTFRIFHGQKNRLANMVKNFSIERLIVGFGISILFDILRISVFLINGRFDSILAVLKGNYYFIKELPKTLKKRKVIQANRKLSDAEMSIMGLIAPLSVCIQEYRRIEG